MRTIALFAVAASLSLVACGPRREHLGDQFVQSLYTMNETTPEEMLRFQFVTLHMDDDDIECMMAEAQKVGFTDFGSGRRGWTAEQLNEFAATCDVVVSDLWVELEVGR